MDAETVFGIIKEWYLKHGSPMPLWILYNLARKEDIGTKKVRWCLVYLHRIGKIEISDSHIIPCLDEEELEFMEKLKKEVPVTLDKIKICIRKFYERTLTYPKPSDIEKMFLELFGNPDIKDFTRHLRKLVEQGLLCRTSDYRYYFKGLNSKEVGLRAWI